MSWYYYERNYERTTPKATHDGIRLQSARGPVGETWWGKRWVEALEKLCDSGRLSRGKSYARKGQVLNIEIEAGRVKAKVQGSSSRPYRVEISLPVLEEKDWNGILTALEASPLPLARMLAGEMPPELEEIFKSCGQQLFPQRRGDLSTDCSCPDWSDPCKHIAAVYYLLAEQFDSDPFLLLKLRGMARENLLERLSGSAAQALESEADHSEPLPIDPIAFWQVGTVVPELQALGTPDPTSLLQRIKSPPMWRGQTPFLEAIEPVYPVAAKTARAAIDGELLPEPHPSRILAAPAGRRRGKAASGPTAKVSRPATRPVSEPSTAKPPVQPEIAATGPEAELIQAAQAGEVDPEIWVEESTERIEKLTGAALDTLLARQEWQAAVNLAHAAGRHAIAARALIELGEAEDAVELICEQLDKDIDLIAFCERLEAAGRHDLVQELALKALEQ